MTEKNLYPHLVIKKNEHPKLLYAFPFVGLFIKLIMLIPVFIMALVLSFVFVLYWLITPFVILTTGKYWDTAYEFNLTYFTYITKIALFVLGLTDKYPGFNFETYGSFELHLEKPKSPSVLLAFPLLGAFIRIVLLIPYLIFQRVLQNGTRIALVISWFGVVLTRKFPESLYEFERDTIRVSLASVSYLAYLSDSYPSFSISMKHQVITVLLIIAGGLILLSNMSSNFSQKRSMQYYQYNYHNTPQNVMWYTP